MNFWPKHNNKTEQSAVRGAHAQTDEAVIHHSRKMCQSALAIFVSFVLVVALIPSVALESAYADNSSDESTTTQDDHVATNDGDLASLDDIVGSGSITGDEEESEDPVFADDDESNLPDDDISILDASGSDDVAVIADNDADNSEVDSESQADAPAKVTGLSSTISMTNKTLALSWSKVSDATSYTVKYYVDGSQNPTVVESLTSTSYTISMKASGETYAIEVCAVRDGVEGEPATAYRWAASTGAPSTSMSTVSSLSTSWSAVSNAGGYEVSYLVGSGSWSSALSAGSSTSYNISLSSSEQKKAIAVKARAYRTIDGQKYIGPWSSVVYRHATQTAGLNTSMNYSNKTIAVSWNKVSGASSYKLQYKSVGGAWSTKTTTSTSYTIKSLKSGKAYQIRVYPVFKTSINGGTHSMDGVAQLTYRYFTLASASTSLTSTSSLTVSWSKVSGASGYEMQYIIGSGSTWTSGYKGTGTSAKISISAKKAIAVRVRANYTNDGKTYTGQWNTIYRYSTKLSGQSSTLTYSNKSIKVSWNKVSGASSYRLQYKSVGGKWSTKTTSSTSYTIKNLKNGKAYQVRVYPIFKSKINGGTHSCIGICQNSYRLMSSTTPSLSRSGTTVKATLSKASTVTGYEVQYSTKSSFSSSTTKKITSRTLSITGVDKKTTYYVKARAYYVKDGKTYTGGWSSAKKNEGVTSAQTKMENKAQSYSSNTKYLILVNCSTHKVGVFTGKKNAWTISKYYDCTTGASGTPTKKGTFSVGSKGKSFGTSSYTCWYWTQWSGNYLFHSVLYKPGSMSKISDGRLGMSLSHGCVRLAIDNAKWIYNNVPRGTKVVVY